MGERWKAWRAARTQDADDEQPATQRRAVDIECRIAGCGEDPESIDRLSATIERCACEPEPRRTPSRAS